MHLDIATWIMFALAAGLTVLAWRRGQFTAGMVAAWAMTRRIIILIPLAVLAAGFMTELMPRAAITALVGAESGLSGILIASVIGGALPGGPFISWPLAMSLWQSGAGAPQVVALITGWGVYALYRTVMFEAPVMGLRFVGQRLLASLVLPPLAGLLTALVAPFASAL
ncbi:MAG: hypothetical protein RIE31_07500 [Alphaproteobacteria bacterium]